MIEFENTEVVGWEAAIRGMRNPMNSWERSDSQLCKSVDGFEDCRVGVHGSCPRGDEGYFKEDIFCVGKNDFELMQRLARAGTDHRKYMRMIVVYADVTAPLYWWKEFDTYKVGTVANSESTMHTITDRPLMLDDFAVDYIKEDDDSIEHFMEIIFHINDLRDEYIVLKEGGDHKYARKTWYKIIQFLPSSFLQKRTVQLNYEVLANIYRARKNHKLDEWREFCHWVESLPYSELITGEEKLND